MKRLGLIGRCDSRGIAYQTLEFARAMRPDATLNVLLNDRAWPEDPGRFHRVGGNNFFVDSDLSTRRLDERKVRQFLRDIDILFAVETVYDWRMIDWAHDADVEVVIQGNPEFYVHHTRTELPHPNEWVWPTPWLVGDQVPDGEVLPVPCPNEAPYAPADPDDPTLRIAHVAGHAAAGDRNGTLEFLEMLPSLRAKFHVTITSQDGSLPRPVRHGKNVTVDVHPNGFADRWKVYDNQHLVVLPRKYGGLCIPALEAMTTGCAILMPDCSPNEIWPGPRLRARRGRKHRAPHGLIQTYTVHPLEMAREVDRLAENRNALRDEMEQARHWATTNSWAELGPMLYEEKLR